MPAYPPAISRETAHEGALTIWVKKLANVRQMTTSTWFEVKAAGIMKMAAPTKPAMQTPRRDHLRFPVFFAR